MINFTSENDVNLIKYTQKPTVTPVNDTWTIKVKTDRWIQKTHTFSHTVFCRYAQPAVCGHIV